MKTSVRVGLASAFLSIFIFAAARADCPASVIYGVSSLLPADSMDVRGNVGAYDLHVGYLYTLAGSGLGGPNDSYTAGSDLYRVDGLPPGTPVDLTAHLLVWGDAFGTGSHGWGVQWKITSGSAADSGFYMTVEIPLQPTDLALAIHAVAGQDFPVTWRVAATQSVDDAKPWIRGWFSFLDLPAGASVRSCQGYGGSALPARPVTWGSLKAIYR